MQQQTRDSYSLQPQGKRDGPYRPFQAAKNTNKSAKYRLLPLECFRHKADAHVSQPWTRHAWGRSDIKLGVCVWTGPAMH